MKEMREDMKKEKRNRKRVPGCPKETAGTNRRAMRRWALALAVCFLAGALPGAEGKRGGSGMDHAYAAGHEDGEGKTEGEEADGREAAAEKTVSEEEAGDYAFLLHPQGGPENYVLLYAALEDEVVVQGGNLWKMAEEKLGDGGRWQEIAQINGLSDPDLILPGEKLAMPDLRYYMQKPAIQRGKGYYLTDEGAFRFQTPECWPLGTCSLDSHLSTFIGEDSSIRVLWGIEDNRMGEDAWAEEWDSVCRNAEETARIVFDESLRDIFFEKYGLEGGGEVYYIGCTFADEEGKPWTVGAAYRFGEKNLMEFIGIGPSEHRLDIGRLTLYTAATYEEYGEERHMGYGEDGAVYKGMAVWQYPLLHNPFVIAYECTNRKTWHQKRELEEEEEDYVVEWKEPVLPAIIRKALGIEGDIMYSDLLEIESLEAIESVGYDYCSINEERFETDWKDIPNGDALLADIAQCRALCELRLQIGDISDFSPVGELKLLEELEIQAGQTVKDVRFLDELEYLRQCVLETAPQQIFVDSLSDRLWERTCEEEGLTTFRKWYDGEPGRAFDEVNVRRTSSTRSKGCFAKKF